MILYVYLLILMNNLSVLYKMIKITYIYDVIFYIIKRKF
ncbi:hypothetical protein MUGA111182_12230 [Mucilaginibacter galii]